MLTWIFAKLVEILILVGIGTGFMLVFGTMGWLIAKLIERAAEKQVAEWKKEWEGHKFTEKE